MGGGVVVSHENGIPWTLPFPSVVEKWSQGGGGLNVMPHLYKQKQEIDAFNPCGCCRSSCLSFGRGWWGEMYSIFVHGRNRMNI